MEPMLRIKVRCNKNDECDGMYRYPGKKKDQKCLHHGEHDLIRLGASQPRVACPKADHCPLRIKDAHCLLVKQLERI
jgi:hypothetical protein